MCYKNTFSDIVGAATGLGASGVNYLAKKKIEKYVNQMVEEQESGYSQFMEALKNFQEYIEEKFKDDKTVNEFMKKWSTESECNGENSPGESNGEGWRNAGKAASVAANAERMSRVAPFLKFVGMSNRATRVAMFKDAISVANLAKKTSGLHIITRTK